MTQKTYIFILSTIKMKHLFAKKFGRCADILTFNSECAILKRTKGLRDFRSTSLEICSITTWNICLFQRVKHGIWYPRGAPNFRQLGIDIPLCSMTMPCGFMEEWRIFKKKQIFGDLTLVCINFPFIDNARKKRSAFFTLLFHISCSSKIA